MTSDEVLNEFEKVKREKESQMIAIEASKKQFADYLRKNEIQLQTIGTPVKRKLPFKFKWHKFINKIKYIMN